MRGPALTPLIPASACALLWPFTNAHSCALSHLTAPSASPAPFLGCSDTDTEPSAKPKAAAAGAGGTGKKAERYDEDGFLIDSVRGVGWSTEHKGV